MHGIAPRVQAAVIDLSADTPCADDKFFVDTNVWGLLTYAKSTLNAGNNRRKILKTYQNYISACLSVNNKIFWSPLLYSELASTIEKEELKIYNRRHATDLDKKDFRHLPAERKNVVSEMSSAWPQIENMGVLLRTPVDPTATQKIMSLFQSYPLDGYDPYYINAMKEAGMRDIITDDIDFIFVPGLRIFTANPNAIDKAGDAEKLIKR